MIVFADYNSPTLLVYWQWNDNALKKVAFFKSRGFRYDGSTKTWSSELPATQVSDLLEDCPFNVHMKNNKGKFVPFNESALVESKETVKIEKSGCFAEISIPSYKIKDSDVPKKIKDYWIYGVSKNELLLWSLFCETLSNNPEGKTYFDVTMEKDLPEIPIIALMEHKMFQHQREGVRFLINRKRAILADDMGLGKTYQSLLASEHLFYEGRVRQMVIVCPPTLMGNWREEIKKWNNPVPFEIIPYSMVHKHDGVFAERTLVILDEAHYLKNSTARRTTSCFNMFKGNKNISYMWLMTGTPVTKDNGDLFPLAYLLDMPWCQEFTPMRMASMKGTKNVILNGLFAPWMLIRKKEDVLDLPEKLTQTIEVNTNIKPDYEILKHGSVALIMEHLMKIKRMCAEAKTEETLEFARNVLDGGKKVVIFSDHTKVLEELEVKLKKWGMVRIDGQTPVNRRQDLVNKFQKDEKTMVFLGNIRAAGVGITLTASSTVIFNDLTWLPSDMNQASCRVHRIGQKGTVNIYYLVDKHLITDAIISKILFRRSEEIGTFELCKSVIMTELKAFIEGGDAC